MKTLKFKTNINCGGCVSKVTPFLEKQKGIESWEVDINNPDKVLEVKSKWVSEKQIVSILDKIGFKAEKIN